MLSVHYIYNLLYCFVTIYIYIYIYIYLFILISFQRVHFYTSFSADGREIEEIISKNGGGGGGREDV